MIKHGRWIATIFVLAAVYFAAAKLGLTLAFVHPSATAVWPPTGISLAALLVLGYKAWPGIFLGAFLANLATAGTAWTSIGIATGNTLEGLIGAFLINRYAGGSSVFHRAHAIVKFAILAAVLSTTVSATIGVTTLSLGGVARWSDYPSIWLTWWLGDATGALIFAAPVILWARGPPISLTTMQTVERILYLAAVMIVGWVVFGGVFAFEYLTVPLLVYAAFRFRERETATLIALLSVIAVWGTNQGRGPFVGATENDSLLLVQTFMAMMALISLPLAAVVAKREGDMTEEVQRRRRSEFRFRELFENTNDIVYARDPAGNITSLNKAGERVTGYGHDESISISQLVAPEYLDLSGEILRRIARGEAVAPYALEIVAKDGRRVPLEISERPIVPGSKLVEIQTIARDISERKEAERQILKQLETISALYATAQKLSQGLNLQQHADFVVRTCVKTFGVDRAYLAHTDLDGSLSMLARASEDIKLATEAAGDEFPNDQVLTGEALRSGFPVVVSDVATAPDLPPELMATWQQSNLRSMGAFPLISRNRPFGVLLLCSGQPGFLSPERTDFFRAFATLAAAALENARLFQETTRLLARVQALRDVDAAISGTLDLRVILHVILDKVITQLQVDAADVLVVNGPVLEHVAGRGFYTVALQHAKVRLGEEFAGRAALDNHLVTIPDLRDTPGEFLRSSVFAIEKFVGYCAVPLSVKGKVEGVLEVFRRSPLHATPDWVAVLEMFAGQTGIAIDHVGLFDDLQHANVELVRAYDNTLEGWIRAVDLRDKETEGHTLRVADITVRLARVIGMSGEQLIHVRRGALLHDIGKIGIPDAILLKPGPLTEAEWGIMRLHPVHAYAMLSPIDYLKAALDIPYCHHEKWNGAGYPRGLSASQIPLAARIFAVVDVWDALLSERPYRPAWTEEQAREYIREQAGQHFDPDVVEAFLRLQL